MKASTHDSGIGVDITAVERGCTTANHGNGDATSILPNKGGARFWSVPRKFIHLQWRKFQGGFKRRALTPAAALEYTLTCDKVT